MLLASSWKLKTLPAQCYMLKSWDFWRILIVDVHHNHCTLLVCPKSQRHGRVALCHMTAIRFSRTVICKIFVLGPPKGFTVKSEFLLCSFDSGLACWTGKSSCNCQQYFCLNVHAIIYLQCCSQLIETLLAWSCQVVAWPGLTRSCKST